MSGIQLALGMIVVMFTFMALRTPIAIAIYAGLVALTVFGFMRTPSGFIPQQDKGYLILNVQLPDSASVERTDEVLRRLEKMFRETKGIRHVVTISGMSFLLSANSSNFGSMPWYFSRPCFQLSSDIALSFLLQSGV